MQLIIRVCSVPAIPRVRDPRSEIPKGSEQLLSFYDIGLYQLHDLIYIVLGMYIEVYGL